VAAGGLKIHLHPGDSTRLGAHCVVTAAGLGVNFAIWSETATRVELCVFDGSKETRHELPARSNGVWHGFLPGATAGLRYGYRVHGEYDPANGRRCNPAKLLIDPYGRSLSGDFAHDDRLFDFVRQKSGWSPDHRDSAPVVPKCVVVDHQFDWQGVSAPGTALEDSIIYELHVKGFTQQHPQVPEALRGKYLGLAEPAVIDYLKMLGVTAVELLPCASFVSESSLVDRGLSNYWGYNTINFFAPHAGYACNDPIVEFQTMVRAMHDAGIEVIVDVVYNHTAEGDAWGPTLCFRGIDNHTYYQLRQHDKSAYVNNSGCGNSVAVQNPAVLRLVLDSLRYWVEVMHVDGFRFDLAPSLARVNGEYDYNSPFLQTLYQDPVLSQVKLIAEPWDVGHAGYRLGQFPPGWAEWNDHYRATVRSFWRGDEGVIGQFASRLAGSSDIFGRRGPGSGVNYITSHDGFSLEDLVSHQRRHNEANGENNADGEQHSNSWNHGVEGPTDDPEIQNKRQRDKRALLGTLLLSQGVPMLLAGDELGRTQQGNNNAYCQDNEISWLDWAAADHTLIDFVSGLIKLRRELAVLRRREFLVGTVSGLTAVHDVQWLTAAGEPMKIGQWRDAGHRALAVLLRGDLKSELIDARYRLDGDDALVLINGADVPVSFTLPMGTGPWNCVMETAPGDALASTGHRAAPRSVVLLVSRNG